MIMSKSRIRSRRGSGVGSWCLCRFCSLGGIVGRFYGGITGDPGVLGVVGDAAGHGQWFDWSHLNRAERGLLPHPGEPIAVLQGHLHEKGGRHGGEVMPGQGLLDAVELSGHAFEFVFVTGQVLLLDTLELHVFEEVDFSLMFDVPPPEGGFADVDVLRDFIKAPAIGAKGHEFTKFACRVHRFVKWLNGLER